MVLFFVSLSLDNTTLLFFSLSPSSSSPSRSLGVIRSSSDDILPSKGSLKSFSELLTLNGLINRIEITKRLPKQAMRKIL